MTNCQQNNPYVTYQSHRLSSIIQHCKFCSTGYNDLSLSINVYRCPTGNGWLITCVHDHRHNENTMHKRNINSWIKIIGLTKLSTLGRATSHKNNRECQIQNSGENNRKQLHYFPQGQSSYNLQILKWKKKNSYVIPRSICFLCNSSIVDFNVPINFCIASIELPPFLLDLFI